MKIIAQYNTLETTLEVDLAESWFEVKGRIIKELCPTVQYIDIEFINQRPIREFGKQALLLGIFGRLYDDYRLGDFFINTNRELKFNVTAVDINVDKMTDINRKKKKYYSYDNNEFPPLSAKPVVSTQQVTTETKIAWGKK